MPLLDNRFRFAVEIRHPSWFQDLSYSFFAIQIPPVVTTDFVYVRFIGDRSIREKDFGRIQIDRIAEMQKCADIVKNLQEGESVKQAIIAANNHYAGFGPGTANVFRNILGLAEAKWEDREEDQPERTGPPHKLRQRTLSDFLGQSSTS
jgi:uncharacterized protein YecE (DUF72 family)